MEESLTYLKEQFELPDVDVRSYSPLVLAYIGDGIYELVVRTAVVGQGNRQANALHKKTSTYVKASAQAAMMEAILEDLTEEELAVYKRGRNAKTVSMAGFRAGKVPFAMVKKKYQGNAMSDALDEVVRNGVNEVLKEKELRPVFTPDVDLKKFEEGKLLLEDLRTIALASGEPKQISGKQELYEMIINQYI